MTQDESTLLAPGAESVPVTEVAPAPADCARSAEVSPSAPQPITAILRGLADIAFCTAIVLEPQESDQPLPPWPYLCTTSV